jgi:hypothetical protein
MLRPMLRAIDFAAPLDSTCTHASLTNIRRIAMAVAGTYDVTIKTPMGDQKGTLSVNPGAGDSFTGSVVSVMMGTMDIAEGTIAGETITWTMDMKVPMPMTLEAEATVDGDSITGAVKAGAFGTMPLSGARAG